MLINDNLEAQLRLITSRYIFSCPNLEKKRIGEIATVKAGGDCPITFSKTRTQKCNIPIFSNGTEDRGLYGFTNKANIEGHSITVAARGTIGYCERRLMPFVPIIRLLAITPKEDGAYIYLHQVIRGMKFKKNGSVQQQLTVPEISFIEIPYPHSSVLHEYNKVASPIVEMIERNISENEILTKQHDELLPLLMNGQATVNYHLSVFYAKHNQLYLCLKNSILCPIHLHLHPSITSPAPMPPQPSPPRHPKSSRRSTISHLSAPPTRRNVCHNNVVL